MKDFNVSKKMMARMMTMLTMTLLITACASQKAAVKTVSVTRASYIDSVKDVTYKHIDGKDLKLDIYTLHGGTATNRPVVIYIHGGSWVHGDKSWIRFTSRQAIANGLVKQNYAVVSIDYRLADGKKGDFETELADCRDAIRWVKRNARLYGFDARRVALWGTSADAHLSLVCGYMPKDSTDVRFILDFYGPTDLNKLFRTSLTPIGLGAAKVAIPKLYRERQVMMSIFHDDFCDKYSPINIVTRHCTPTLILHGAKDKLVPIKQAYELEGRLSLYQAEHRTFIYPRLTHGFSSCTRQEIDDMVKQCVDFAHDYFR